MTFVAPRIVNDLPYTHPETSRHPFTEAEEYSFLSSPGKRLKRKQRTQRGIHMFQAKEYNFLSCKTTSHTQVARRVRIQAKEYSFLSCLRKNHHTLYPPALSPRTKPAKPTNTKSSQRNQQMPEIMRACRCKSAYSFHDHPGLFTVTSI